MNMWWTNSLYYSSSSSLFLFRLLADVRTNNNDDREKNEWERTNRLRRRCIVCSQDQHKSALRCRVKASWRSAYARERERENERMYVGQFWWAAAASLSLILSMSVLLSLSLSVIQREGHCIAVQSEHAALLSIAPPVCVTHIQRFPLNIEKKSIDWHFHRTYKKKKRII